MVQTEVKDCPLCQDHERESKRATMDMAEFQELTGLSRGKVYELAALNALPVRVIKLGKRLMLSRAEVHSWLHAGKAAE